ncbi:MAG TPA: hypothetical protein VHM89_09075 [Acidimicrobiales bacterium]|nr:hypothetical protein [Acidimicrobiales bacterium]
MDDEIPPVEEEHEDGVLDRLRDMPVGTLDPNIIGDAGPLDVPPGGDPPDGEAGVDAGSDPGLAPAPDAAVEAALEGRRAFTQP